MLLQGDTALFPVHFVLRHLAVYYGIYVHRCPFFLHHKDDHSDNAKGNIELITFMVTISSTDSLIRKYNYSITMGYTDISLAGIYCI